MIKEYLNPAPSVPEPEKQKTPMENWQKYYENGEYPRCAERTEEQNYNMIDGLMNNLPLKPRKIGERISVLDCLYLEAGGNGKEYRETCAADGCDGGYGA